MAAWTARRRRCWWPAGPPPSPAPPAASRTRAARLDPVGQLGVGHRAPVVDHGHLGRVPPERPVDEIGHGRALVEVGPLVEAVLEVGIAPSWRSCSDTAPPRQRTGQPTAAPPLPQCQAGPGRATRPAVSGARRPAPEPGRHLPTLGGPASEGGRTCSNCGSSTAREAIRDLIARYNANGDAGRFDEVVELFAEDSVMITRAGTFTGRDGVRSVFSRAGQALGNFGGPSVMRHSTSTHEIEITGPDTARSYCYFTVMVGPHGLDHWAATSTGSGCATGGGSSPSGASWPTARSKAAGRPPRT